MATVILPQGSSHIELQNAINNASFGDIIRLSSDMPFTGTVTVRAGLEVTINSNNGSNWAMHHFSEGIRHFEVSGSLILENITLDGREKGGGVRLNLGSFAMQDGAVIQNCRAENGGAIHLVSGVCSLYGGSVTNNTATRGGGLYQEAGMLNISGNVLISGNKAEYGGGIYTNAEARLAGGEISRNQAVRGGGAYVNGGTLSISRGVISGNTADTDGGGIYLMNGASLTVSGADCRILNNTATAGNGGGIFTANAAYANITTGSTTVFSGNKAVAAYSPPENARTLYPRIEFAQVSLSTHPLNNFDINYIGGRQLSYHIIYNANGGTGSYTGPDVRPGGTDTVAAPANIGISRAGYTFVRWDTEPNGTGTPHMPGETLTLTENVTLYAIWQTGGHTVRYNANGGTGERVVENLVPGTGHVVLPLAETGIAYPGMEFVGWNTAADGSGTAYAPGAVITVTGPIVLYAQWSSKKYTVIYDPNGGYGGCTDRNIPYGTEYVVRSPHSVRVCRECYYFIGWNTSPDGKGTFYKPGDKITVRQDITLYAVWRFGERPGPETFARHFCDEFDYLYGGCGDSNRKCKKASYQACIRALEETFPNFKDYFD